MEAEGRDRQRVSKEGRRRGDQKAHTNLRVLTHSPPPSRLPTWIFKKCGVYGRSKILGQGGLWGLLFQNSFLGQKHRKLGARGTRRLED